MKKKQILGVGVSDAKIEEALEFIVTSLQEKQKKRIIFTPNPEIIVAAQKDKAFKDILNEADLALADGVGVMWAGNMLGKPFKARITGVDFMIKLCDEASRRGFTVGLMGGGPKIAVQAAECLLWKYPRLKITFASEGIPIAEAKSGVSSIKYQVSSIKKQESSKIHNTKYIIPATDIIFVALGFPKQEKWIHENLDMIPVRVAMAVGGSFDYISGAVPRAPLLIRRLGLEWLFRLLIQPWRIKRQLALIEFLLLVLKEKFSPA